MATTKTKAEETTTQEYHYGTGRRKTAVAQVRVFHGTGKVLVNDQEVERDVHLARILDLVGQAENLDISAHVNGGGKAGQVVAIGHGLARALIVLNPEFRATLKKAGLLTRDPRERERKKYGLHGARRGPQFSKR